MTGAVAIQYAETNLGVHQVHKKAESALALLIVTIDSMRSLRLEKRRAEDVLEDYETDMTVDERGAAPRMSITAFKDHMKSQLRNDKTCRDLRLKVAELAERIDALSHDKNLYEREIAICCARMSELGGYLSYLAAVKNAATKS